MYQNIIGQQQHLQQKQQDSSASDQMSMSPPPTTERRRRQSFWDKLTAGAVHASEVDIHGFHEPSAEGFAPAGAKFDETFGNSALFETGFDAPHHNQDWQKQRTELSEDALRQMS